jgi:putative DNA methylase
MRYYQRRLPHWDVVGQPLFVTFRLHGSLPAGRDFSPSDVNDGQAFATLDRILDHAVIGPTHLRNPQIAAIVVNSLRDGDSRFSRYELHAFVVMPNHVHILATPRVTAAKWLGPLKGFTAHEANAILGRAGTPFWQGESYDHLVRSDEEFGRIRRYIESNPVRAGLVETPEEFAWSSAKACTKQAAG